MTRGRLDILFVGPLPPYPTGAALACGQIIAGLARRGHRVRALAPITRAAAGGGDAFAAGHAAIEVGRFVVPYFEGFQHDALSDYRSQEASQIRARMSVLIRDGRPDIVLIGREIYGWWVPDVAMAHGLPSVLLSHGGPTTAILGGTWPAAEGRQLLAQLRRVDLVVSVARHWVARLRSLGIERVHAIPNPVDLEQFAPAPRDPRLVAELGIPPGAVVVVHASNLQPVKRPLDFVQAAVRASREDSRLSYVVLGSTDGGGGSLGSQLREACRKTGIADRVRIVPWVDHERVPGYLRLADLVVVPSEHETQALVYLETQACARVLVASDIPAAREVVEDGVSGLLFPTGDTAALAATILRAAGDPILQARLGRHGRDAVRGHDIETTVAAYESVLERVAGGAVGPLPS